MHNQIVCPICGTAVGGSDPNHLKASVVYDEAVVSYYDRVWEVNRTQRSPLGKLVAPPKMPKQFGCVALSFTWLGVAATTAIGIVFFALTKSSGWGFVVAGGTILFALVGLLNPLNRFVGSKRNTKTWRYSWSVWNNLYVCKVHGWVFTPEHRFSMPVNQLQIFLYDPWLSIEQNPSDKFKF